jgi:hypothetical protein
MRSYGCRRSVAVAVAVVLATRPSCAYEACGLGPGSQTDPVNATLEGEVIGNFVKYPNFVGTDHGVTEEWSYSANGCSRGCVSFDIICTSRGILRMNALLRTDCPGSDCSQSDSAWIRCECSNDLQASACTCAIRCRRTRVPSLVLTDIFALLALSLDRGKVKVWWLPQVSTPQHFFHGFSVHCNGILYAMI